MRQSRHFFSWKPTDGISCVPVSLILLGVFLIAEYKAAKKFYTFIVTTIK